MKKENNLLNAIRQFDLCPSRHINTSKNDDPNSFSFQQLKVTLYTIEIPRKSCSFINNLARYRETRSFCVLGFNLPRQEAVFT